MLISHGHKISHIAKMGDLERVQHVQGTYKEVSGYEGYIQRLLLGMIALDEHDFDKVIKECFAQKGTACSYPPSAMLAKKCRRNAGFISKW